MWNAFVNHGIMCLCPCRSGFLQKRSKIENVNISLYREHFHLLKSWKRGLPRWPLGGPLGAKFRSKNFKYLSRITHLAFSLKKLWNKWYVRFHLNTHFDFYLFSGPGNQVFMIRGPPNTLPWDSFLVSFWSQLGPSGLFPSTPLGHSPS